MTRYPTQAHYPDTVLTSPCPILLMPSTRLGSDKYQFCKSLFDLAGIRASALEGRTLLIRLPRPVSTMRAHTVDAQHNI